MEADLSAALGLKVEIVDRGGQGEVRVRYAALEQLDEICRRLSRRYVLPIPSGPTSHAHPL